MIRSLIRTCTVTILTSHERPHSRQARLADAAPPVPFTAAGRSPPLPPAQLAAAPPLATVHPAGCRLVAATARAEGCHAAATRGRPPACNFLFVPRRRPPCQPPALLATFPPPLAAPHADCLPDTGRRPRRRPPPRRRFPPPTRRAAAAPVAGCRHRRSPTLVVVSAPSLPATPQTGSRPLRWLVAARPRSRFAANACFHPAADSGPSRWLPPFRRSAPPPPLAAAAPAAGCRRPRPWLTPPPPLAAAAPASGCRRVTCGRCSSCLSLLDRSRSRWSPPLPRAIGAAGCCPPVSRLCLHWLPPFYWPLTAPLPAAFPLAAHHPACCRAAALLRPYR